MDESAAEVLIDGLWTEGVYVHSLAGDEVLDAALNLRRTASVVGAVPGGLTLITDEWCAALRTALDELHGLGDDGTLVNIDPHNLGDNLTTLLDIDVVADV